MTMICFFCEITRSNWACSVMWVTWWASSDQGVSFGFSSTTLQHLVNVSFISYLLSNLYIHKSNVYLL